MTEKEKSRTRSRFLKGKGVGGALVDVAVPSVCVFDHLKHRTTFGVLRLL